MRTLRATNPELADKYDRVRSGKPNWEGADDESGGHARRESITPKDQGIIDRAFIKPEQRVAAEQNERTAARQEAQDADNRRYRDEQLRQGWAQLRQRDEELKKQLERMDRSSLSTDSNIEFNSVKEQYGRTSAALRELMKQPEALRDEGQIATLDGELKDLASRLNQLGNDARDRRNAALARRGEGQPASNDPLGLRSKFQSAPGANQSTRP
jgi:hypothetical protein